MRLDAKPNRLKQPVGTMDEEFLVWDNFTFMKQIGLAP
jgi:hypothetical protein